MNNIQFPLLMPQHPLRRAVKVLGGRLLGILRAGRRAQLLRGEVGARLSAGDRILIAALVDAHERAGNLSALMPLQKWLWSGTQAVSFHQQAEARFSQWWLQRDCQILQPLQTLLRERPGRYHTLCEIGCGSGLVLADIAGKLGELQNFIGLDLSTEQTALNRKRFRDSKLRFESGDASVWIPQNAKAGWFYLTVAGVLEYFDEASLCHLLLSIAQRAAPAGFGLIEPLAVDFDLARETRSRPQSAERTLAHSYIKLFESCGWRVRWQEDRQHQGRRHLLLIAETG